MTVHAKTTEQRGAVWTLSIVTLALWFALYSYTSYLTPFLDLLGASGTMAGLVAGSYGFAMMLCRVPIGIWADRIGRRKPFVIAGSALVAASALGMMVSTRPWAVLLFRTLSGVGVSTWVCYTVLYNSYYPPEKSGIAISNANVLSTIGRLSAGLGGAAAAMFFGMRGAFGIAAVIGAIGLLFSFFVKEERLIREPLRMRQLLKVLGQPWLLFVGLVSASGQLISFGTGLSFVSNIAVSVGASDFQVGLLGAVSALGSFLGLLLLPRVFRRFFSEKMVLILSTLFSMLSCFLYPEATNIYVIFLLQIFTGIATGGTTAMLMSMAVRGVPEEMRATAMGAYQAVYAIGILLGPVVTGAMIDWFGMTGAFRGVSAFGALTVIAVLIFYDRLKQY